MKSLPFIAMLALTIGLCAVVFVQNVKLRKSSKSHSVKQANLIKNKADYISDFKNQKIVFLGDSHIERGHWNAHSCHKIFNAGISGDMTAGVLERIKAIKAMKPHYLFVMAGVNDLIQNKSIEEISENYSNILKQLPKNTVVFSIMYTDRVKKEKVDELNARLKKMAATFIDLNTEISQEYKYDGLHLNSKGYFLWFAIIEKFLPKCD